MMKYLVTIGLIFALLTGGMLVQRLYRRFARRHPELGPFREDKSGCGACTAGSGCNASSCSTTPR